MAIEQTSGFDPKKDGFHFKNRYNGLDILKEVDDGLGDFARQISESADFWKGWGLCGGMTWHALDRFYAKNSVPATAQIPNRDSPLFRILVLRQIDSFHGANLITKCIKWQSRNSQRQWWDPRSTIRQLTLRQWPTVKDQINRGIPASLTLIRTVINPSDNHQVLAVSYKEDTAKGMAEIGLYDPNRPDQEPTITIELTGASAGKAEQSSGENLRGFFVWPYDRVQRSHRVNLGH